MAWELSGYQVRAYNIMGRWRHEIEVREANDAGEERGWLLLRDETSGPLPADAEDAVDTLLHSLLRSLADADRDRVRDTRPGLGGLKGV